MLSFLLWSALSWAEPTRWWCTLNARTSGNTKEFFTYGRDAWEGETEMRCMRGSEERGPVPVGVHFFSKNPGFGATQSSVLTFSVTIWTETDPSLLSLEVTAPGLLSGNSVYWNLRDGEDDLAAAVWTGSQIGVAQSLELGTLSIKSLLFRSKSE